MQTQTGNRQAETTRLDRLVSMLRTDPANSLLYRQCVDTAAASGRFDIVLDVAQSALQLNPIDPSALFDKATAQIGQRDYRGSLATLAALGSNDPAVQMNAGLCHYCLGEFVQARPYLENAYAAGIESAGLLRLLVSTHHHLGEVDAAVKIAADNAAVAATDGALAGVFALLYLDAGDAARASRWTKAALDLAPDCIDAQVVQGTLLTARMEVEPARKILEKVVEAVPTTGRAWIGLGTLDLLAQDLPSAMQRLSRGVQLMPAHVGSWHVLAWAQLLSSDLMAAEQTLRHALELDRNFSETHGGLATIAALRGERENAQRLIEVAMRLDPECMSARAAQAILTGRAGNPEQARQILQGAITQITSKDDSALAKLLMRSRKH